MIGNEMKKLIFLPVFLVFILGCPDKNTPVIHYPTDITSCSSACSHLRDLKCQEGNPKGVTCEQFCIDTQMSGHALEPSCVVNIKKCEDMDNIDAFCPKPDAGVGK